MVAEEESQFTNVSEFLELVDLVLEGSRVHVVVARDGVGKGGHHTQPGSCLQGKRHERRLGTPQAVCSVKRVKEQMIIISIGSKRVTYWVSLTEYA